ncbi:hypothetical protein ACI6PS_03600 [Flavobacterium sp. PLA-1-15]|uniref:hypothetical protein n=1 Tax=Flavobacterium sp. PLA-1-15 TaxID=3380533 RepID=UPI003B7C45AA
MGYKSYLGQNSLPRGIRNNNPGNLVKTSETWLGKVPHSQNTDSRFEQFIELRYGIRAKMRDLITDITKGKNTIEKLIHEFAPAFENNTVAYIETVVKLVGFPATQKITSLTEDSLIALCKAIASVENGTIVTKYITDQDYKDAIAILGNTAIPIEKKKAVKLCQS